MRLIINKPRTSHAAERLAQAIVAGTRGPADPRTLAAWGQEIGVSRGALRVWCAAAHVPARSCLDFLRILRAVILSQSGPWDLFSVLDVVDARSLARLLNRGEVSHLSRGAASPTVKEFLARQAFVRNPDLILAVSRRLEVDLSDRRSS